MSKHARHAPDRGRQARAGHGAAPRGFRLMRYFTTTTLVVFLSVGAALLILQRMEETYFEQAQREQQDFFASAQAQLAQQHEAAARESLLSLHEASHVNLTRLVANVFWESNFAPFVAAAQGFPADRCRAGATEPARRACFAQLRRALMSLPGFKAVDEKAYAAMRSTTVFKIKVFDMRGMTVYSSEHNQIGEDASENTGWRSAAGGKAASELTHRDRFSAFERVVENRDLISTYVPVYAAGRTQVQGVFEIYSDVTPFLERARAANRTFAKISAANAAQIDATMRANQNAVESNSVRFLLIVGSLIALLYVASLLIVRRGQRIIDRQQLAQEQLMQREQLWHREKMAALATMAANVSHEVGNPLAVIWSVAEDLKQREGNSEAVAGAARQILEQSARIAGMTRQIAEFANARSESPQWIDVNAHVKALCDFMAFDRRFRETAIEFHAGPQLLARELVPDHLNEVMMSLIQTCVQDGADRCLCGRVRVETEQRGEDVVIRFGCTDMTAGTMTPAPADARYASVNRRVAEIGGRLSVSERGVEFTLPPSGNAVAPAEPEAGRS